LDESLFGKGRWQETRQLFAAEVQIPIPYPDANVGLSLALAQLGSPAESVEQYRIALHKNPDYLDALNNLAWILAANADPKLRNGTEAASPARHACQLTDWLHNSSARLPSLMPRPVALMTPSPPRKKPMTPRSLRPIRRSLSEICHSWSCIAVIGPTTNRDKTSCLSASNHYLD
jgi:hypothetical protein